MTIDPKSPLALTLLGFAFVLSGSWLGDKMGIVRDSSAEAIRVQALEKRVEQTQAEISDYQHGALTASQFNEFRLANDRRLDDIREDIKSLETDLRLRR